MSGKGEGIGARLLLVRPLTGCLFLKLRRQPVDARLQGGQPVVLAAGYSGVLELLPTYKEAGQCGRQIAEHSEADDTGEECRCRCQTDPLLTK